MKTEYVVNEITDDNKIKVAIFELANENEEQSEENFVGVFDFTKKDYENEKLKDGNREFFNEEILENLA